MSPLPKLAALGETPGHGTFPMDSEERRNRIDADETTLHRRAVDRQENDDLIRQILEMNLPPAGEELKIVMVVSAIFLWATFIVASSLPRRHMMHCRDLLERQLHMVQAQRHTLQNIPLKGTLT